MKGNLSAVRMRKKALSFVLAIGMGAFTVLPGMVDARLIFTTEEDGVNSEEYHLDIDDTSADNIDLAFGSGVAALLRYSTVSTKFIFNQPVEMRVDNQAAAPTCNAGAAGKLYFNTGDSNLYFCDGTSWVSSTAIADDSITGAMLHPDVAGDALVQDGSGNLDVNPGTGMEISGDTIIVSDDGITAAKLAADTAGLGIVQNAGTGALDLNVDGTTLGLTGDVVGIADGGVDTTQLADGAVTYAKVDAFSIDTDLSDGATASTFASSTAVKNYVDTEVGALAAGLIYRGAFSAAANPNLRTQSTGDTYIDALGLTENYSKGDFFKITVDGTITDGTNSVDVYAGDMIIVNKVVQHNAIDVSTDIDVIDNTEAADLLSAGDLASGEIFVGDGTTTPNGVAVSGDIALTSAGLTTIQDGAVDLSDIQGLASGSFILGTDGTTAGNSSATMSGDMLMSNTGVTTIQQGAVEATAIEGLASAEFIIGVDGTAANNAKVTMSGDATMSNAGVLTIANDAVGSAEIIDASVAFVDVANRNVSALIAPEYPNFTLQADGTRNRGTLESNNDSASSATAGRNFYEWRSRRSANLNDYDLIFKWVIPENFQSLQGATPIQVDFKTETTAAVDNAIDFYLYDEDGSSIALTGATDLQSAVADTWETHNLSFTSPFVAADAGKTITIRMKMYSRDNNSSYVGNVKFNYVAK